MNQNLHDTIFFYKFVPLHNNQKHEIMIQERESFSSKFGIIAAAAGSAIGLGNIWRFPYLAGENGGGAFLIVYLIAILAIGIPAMLSELIIGRKARSNPYRAFKSLAPKQAWFIIGIMGIGAAFLILAFYTTVAGWTLEYIFVSASNGLAGKSTTDLNTMFDGFISSDIRPVLWQLLFMFLTAFIVLGGIQKGIEKASKILMPVLFVIVILLIIRSLSLPNASKGLSFFFNADFSKMNADVIVQAIGQAAFSLSIGMGTMITYGSYIKKHENLTSTAIQVSITDTLFAILAGVMIFPAVFAYGFQPNEGPDLVFKVLPVIFQQMSGGYFFGLAFFILLSIAALTSTISVLEVVVAYFSEEFKITRKKATLYSSILISIFGVFCTLSFGSLSDVTIFNLTIFGLFEYTSANILLPLGALFIVLFIGWKLGKSFIKNQLNNEGSLKSPFANTLIFMIKFIVPLALTVVFMYQLGLIKL